MLIVKLADAFGTSYFGNITKASFVDGGGVFTQVSVQGAAVIDAAGFTMTIYTEAGHQLEQRTIPKENAVANVGSNTAETDRPRVRPGTKRRRR